MFFLSALPALWNAKLIPLGLAESKKKQILCDLCLSRHSLYPPFLWRVGEGGQLSGDNKSIWQCATINDVMYNIIKSGETKAFN